MSELTQETEESEERTVCDAIRSALHTEMERDDDVVLMGEDVAEAGGVFRATDGLLDAFGEDRVIDTPLAENAIIGTAVGLAEHGLKPVAEIQFQGFMPIAFDQIVSQAARMRFKTRGRFTCPLVIRSPYGTGVRSPEYHAESKESWYVHEPGLKVVVPGSPYDAKGLLISAMRDPDPVCFFEPQLIYRTFKESVPDGSYEVPIGEARVRREGSDLTLLSWGAMTRPSLVAASELEGDVDVEVIDLRTLYPFDRDTIVESLEKTGRAVIVHEAHRTLGMGAELAAQLQEDALLNLEAPINRLTGFDTPVPLKGMEDYYLPEPERITAAIRETASYP
jgi:pyruvate dehydrogenase E1 component beta subunit